MTNVYQNRAQFLQNLEYSLEKSLKYPETPKKPSLGTFDSYFLSD